MSETFIDHEKSHKSITLSKHSPLVGFPALSADVSDLKKRFEGSLVVYNYGYRLIPKPLQVIC